MGLANDQGFLN